MSAARTAPVGEAPRPFAFGSKAETLQLLTGRLEHGRTLPQRAFTLAAWGRDPEGIVAELCQPWSAGSDAPGEVVVRSSARIEDGARASMAGAFDSVLGVPCTSQDLFTAIARVVGSLPGLPDDQVLVQPMLRGIAVSGVVMSHEIEHGSPYHVVEYDDHTGRTDTITGGTGVSKFVRVYREAAVESIRSPRLRRFVELVRDVERIAGGVPVDIEFALTDDGTLFLLQARRISLRRNWHPGTHRRVGRQLRFVAEHLGDRARPQPGIVGARTVLGSMPDWNPAEIIGTTPRPLAASLYRELVTRSVWREARALMGYRSLPPVELMVILGGHAFIDVRNSLNSFVPAGVDDVTAARLVDAWTHRLAEHPELHDKIEFEVAATCRDFSLERALWRRYPGVLDASQQAEWIARLGGLTSRLLRPGPGSSLAWALRESAALHAQQQAGAGRRAGGSCAREALVAARQHVVQATRPGALAFAVAARHGFVAEALLRSAVERGALAPERLDAFRRSVRTVTRQLAEDFGEVLRGGLSREAFLERYGHLRPGTYDVTSMRYDERDDLFDGNPPPVAETADDPFGLEPCETRSLARLLDEARLGIEPGALLDHARAAIAARESCKLVFTRSLSDALRELGTWAETCGLDREDLSFLDWRVLEDQLEVPTLDEPDRQLGEVVAAGRRRWAEATLLRLPHLLRDEGDLWVAPVHRSRPNFVGRGRVVGRVVPLSAQSSGGGIGGAIVCIENADPGFDWIFTMGIAGLVTRFGGPNSHMAIRCAEFGLPAAIGCGEVEFDAVRAAPAAELDCGSCSVRPLLGVAA